MPPAQQHCDLFRYRRAAFFNGLESKVGLAAAKATAVRVNLNIDGCVALPVHLASRAPLLLAINATCNLASRLAAQTPVLLMKEQERRFGNRESCTAARNLFP